MNFDQLREIIKNVKTRLTCSSCNSNYLNEDIHVLNAIADKCVLLVNCKECGTPMLVTATVNQNKLSFSHDEVNQNKSKISEKALVEQEITCDDVLEIHGFLKDFDGDFETILSSKPNHLKK